MKKRKILAVLLAAAMLVSAVPGVHAATAAPTAPTAENLHPAKREYGDGVVLNKWATSLSNNNETEITLTVTAPDNSSLIDTNRSGAVAVEFVLDGTDSFNDLTDQDNILALANSVKKIFSGRTVFVGITVFGRDAKTVQAMAPLASLTADSRTLMEETVAWLLKPESLGTNVQSGIRTGLADLNKAPAGVEKCMILVTDGGSYWWLDQNGTPANNTLDGDLLQNSDAADMNYASFAPLKELLAGSVSASARNFTGASALEEIKADPDTYTNFETGVYWAAKELEALPKDVSLITFSRPYYPNDSRLTALTRLAGEFIDKADTRSVAFGTLEEDWELTDAMAELITLRDVAIPAGAQVIDAAGKTHSFETENYRFDIVKNKDVTVTVTDENGVLYQDSGKLKDTLRLADGYDLTLKDNVLTLTLGKDLLLGQVLTITFTEKLASRDSKDGAHYLLTNYEAYVETPDGRTYDFPEPVVKYTSGNDNPPPLLNTADHYSYIIGYPQGDVRPLGNLIRAEAVTIFFRMLTDEARDYYWYTENPYSDVNETLWFNNAVSTITNMGIINGRPDGTFLPYANITRAEFAKIAVGFFDQIVNEYHGQFKDVDESAWYSAYIQAAYEQKLILGYPDGTFRPNQPITRAEACTIINRMLGRLPHPDHLLSDEVMVTWPDNLPGVWYYEAMQEATNSHDYKWITDHGDRVEEWTEKLPQRDWAALEREWSTSHSAPYDGEVVN